MQRIRMVFDWAKASGHRQGDNPVEGVSKVLPKQNDAATHHAALPYGQISKFVKKLRNADAEAASRLAFEFMILTAVIARMQTAGLQHARTLNHREMRDVITGIKVKRVPGRFATKSAAKRMPLATHTVAMPLVCRVRIIEAQAVIPNAMAVAVASRMSRSGSGAKVH